MRNSELTTLQPDVLRCPEGCGLGVGSCCASFSSVYLAGIVLGKTACLLRWLRKAADCYGGFCRTASCPERKWAEEPPNPSIPGAEDHAGRVPAADVPFLCYCRLNDSKPRQPPRVATGTHKIGVLVSGRICFLTPAALR